MRAKRRSSILSALLLPALAACSPSPAPSGAAATGPAEETPAVTPAAADTAAPASNADAAQAAIDRYLQPLGPMDGEAPTNHRDAFVDLDGDGRDELLAYLEGPMVCGSGGCTLVVFAGTDGGFDQVAELSVTRSPIAVGEAGDDGWRDLLVTIAGGGGPSGVVRVAHGAEGYPGNPTVLQPVLDAMPADARVVIE